VTSGEKTIINECATDYRKQWPDHENEENDEDKCELKGSELIQFLSQAGYESQYPVTPSHLIPPSKDMSSTQMG